ncbi:MAG TPA: metalloendopeptidase [Magnetospirillum sp.]|jgi:hypothetical protein|nr:metalloendopeptidase [Magnetospirillum sp.]
MDVQKLAKVLALAASDNDTEALQALRTAKRLLEGEGADFVELARRLTEGAQSDAVGREVLEDAIFDLRNEIRHLRSENERLKQGRGGGPAPAAEPPSFQDAARAAADVIRLRAELANLSDALTVERDEVLRMKAVEANLHQSFQEALAEAGRAMAQLREAEARRMRLEAENRRLLHANHALSVDLAEARAARPAPEPEPMQPKVPVAAKQAPRRKAKGAASQFALL